MKIQLKFKKLVGALMMSAVILGLCGCQAAEKTPTLEVEPEVAAEVLAEAEIEENLEVSEEAAKDDLTEVAEAEADEAEVAETEESKSEPVKDQSKTVAQAVVSKQAEIAADAGQADASAEAIVASEVIETSTEPEEAHHEKTESKRSSKKKDDAEDKEDEGDDTDDDADQDDIGEPVDDIGEPIEAEEVESEEIVFPWDEIDRDNMPVMHQNGVITYPDGTVIYPDGWEPASYTDEDGSIHYVDSDGSEIGFEEIDIPRYPIIDDEHEPAFPPEVVVEIVLNLTLTEDDSLVLGDEAVSTEDTEGVASIPDAVETEGGGESEAAE